MASTLAFLDGLGAPELLVIGLIALLMFGSKNMPELGRALGRAIREFKRATSGVEENIREVLYSEPAKPTLRPPVQRRPYRDQAAHLEASTPSASPEISDTPIAPPAEASLNEPAPLEELSSPSATESSELPIRRENTPPTD